MNVSAKTGHTLFDGAFNRQYDDTTTVRDSVVDSQEQVLPESPETMADSIAAAIDSALSLKDSIFYSYDFYGNVIDSFKAVIDSAGLLVGYHQYDDTVTIAAIPDLFWQIIDTTTMPYLDSMYVEYYKALSSNLPDEKDTKRAHKKNIKDYKDSVKQATPRVLATFAIPDSMYYNQIITWTTDTRFNEIELGTMDTTFNYNFNEIPFFKKDVNATYLGTVGSAAREFNWFKREHVDAFPAFDPYISYSWTPDNIPQYNTKTPYTELAYWGTLFETKLMEESQVKLLSTQNISPSFNFTLGYRQYGSKGMLQKEETNNRTSFVEANYLGKNYLMNAGYIGQRVIRNENGGLQDPFWVKDTIVDLKTISVNLDKASNDLKRRTVYLTQSLAIPMNFLRKDKDSLSLGEGSMAFIGHSIEFSTYRKEYADNVSSTNKKQSAFYHDVFNVNETESSDIMNVRKLENRIFIKLQPFAPDAIVSKINGGLGYQILSIYDFTPECYITGTKRFVENNMYVYAGAEGMFRKYLQWNADGQYNYAGYNANDLELNGKIKLSAYPFKNGIHLTGGFHTSLKEPDYYQQHLFFNHHKWDNDFVKTKKVQIDASLEIPVTKTKIEANYAIANDLIYYDTLSVIRQHPDAINILSVAAEQNIRLGILHLDNRALFQKSSNEDVVPLPELALNLKYFIEFPVVKDVMTIQLGVNGLLNSAFYAQDYSPDLGVFFNQKKEKIGGWDTPYLDAFANVQWKNVSVYVKYTNFMMQKLTSDFFAAYHYVRPQKGFKFGIFWPFNIR